MLCGEYGENTNRAHYHIIILLDVPLPNLVKVPAKGNHYKSTLIDSKQYGLYDIEPCNASKKLSGYLTKYLLKSDNKQLENYNRFEIEQLEFYKKNNLLTKNTTLFNNIDDMTI